MNKQLIAERVVKERIEADLAVMREALESARNTVIAAIDPPIAAPWREYRQRLLLKIDEALAGDSGRAFYDRISKAEDDCKRLQTQIFSLRDGLRGWKDMAARAAAHAKADAEQLAAIADVCSVLDQLAPECCGTLAERVRYAITIEREVKDRAEREIMLEKTQWPQSVARLEEALSTFPAGRNFLAGWTDADNECGAAKERAIKAEQLR